MGLAAERSAARAGAAFLEWLDGWYRDLPSVSLRGELIPASGGAERVAVQVVDLLVGFCVEGPLASPRVGALGPRSAAFLRDAWDAGVRAMLLATDSHPEDSPEFGAFPPHCVTGTAEAEVIPELASLPFYSRMTRIRKGSINVGLEPELAAWQERHPDVRTWIVIGDCTDFCVYQAAMHFRLQANARGGDVSVVVPAELVETYDLPVEAAREPGALPHDGDLLHRLFLYHMALNGIRVVRGIEP